MDNWLCHVPTALVVESEKCVLRTRAGGKQLGTDQAGASCSSTLQASCVQSVYKEGGGGVARDEHKR